MDPILRDHGRRVSRECAWLRPSSLFLTGPLFLIASLATLLDAFAVVSINWIVIFVGAGTGTVLAYGREWLRGKYVGISVP